MLGLAKRVRARCVILFLLTLSFLVSSYSYTPITFLWGLNNQPSFLLVCFVKLNFYLILLCRFLLTSTSEVYGDPLEHPQTEEYWGNVNPIGLVSENPFVNVSILMRYCQRSILMKYCQRITVKSSYRAGVRSCYDEGKRVAETLAFDYHRQHGLGMFSGYFLTWRDSGYVN